MVHLVQHFRKTVVAYAVKEHKRAAHLRRLAGIAKNAPKQERNFTRHQRQSTNLIGEVGMERRRAAAVQHQRKCIILLAKFLFF